MNPKVSVIMPAYNCGPYIAEAIESVRAQTFSDVEVVVIDDGSTDDTRRIVETFAADPRIRYFAQQNSGQPKARNRGIAEARGEFIAFLDADDAWLPEKLAKQMPLFDRRETGVVYSDIIVVAGNGVDLIDYRRANDFEQMSRGNVLPRLVFYNFVPFSTVVVRRSCFDAAGTLDESLSMGDDWDILLRLAAHFEFDYAPEQLSRYRLGRGGQLSAKIRLRYQNQDRMFASFFGRYAHLLPPDMPNRTRAFRCRERAREFARTSPVDAMRNLWQAVALEPLSKITYVTTLRCCLRYLTGR